MAGTEFEVIFGVTRQRRDFASCAQGLLCAEYIVLDTVYRPSP